MPSFTEIGVAIDNDHRGEDAYHIDQQAGILAVFDGISSRSWKAEITAQRFAEISQTVEDLRSVMIELIREECHESTGTAVKLNSGNRISIINVGDSELLVRHQEAVTRLTVNDTMFNLLFWRHIRQKLEGKEELEIDHKLLFKAFAFSDLPENFHESMVKHLLGEKEVEPHGIKALQLLAEKFLKLDYLETNRLVAEALHEIQKYQKSPTMLAQVALRCKDVLTRCLSHPEIIPDMTEACYQLEDGEILILCTDGITKNLFRHEIFRLLNRHEHLQDAADEIIKKAKKRGFVKDDMTVILAKMDPDATLAA